MYVREGRDQNYNSCSSFSFVISSLRNEIIFMTEINF